MKRIYSLDLLKLFLAYVIAFFHFGTHIAPGPTVTVQIFFLFSGFFLARNYYTRAQGTDGYDQWDYTLDHIRSLYPHYLPGLLLFFGYILARALVYLVLEPSWDAVREIGLLIHNQIPDLLLLQSSYHYHNSLNYPLWQLSALIIASYFVYGLLCRDEKGSRTLLFPAAILAIQSLLHTGVDIWGNWGIFYIPLLRAFSPLCMGVLAYYFTTTTYYETLRRCRIPFNLAVFYALVSVFLYGEEGNIFLIAAVMVLWGCYAEESWINRLLNYPIFRHCGKLSLSIYIHHALISRFLEARVFMPLEAQGDPVPRWQQNLIYFVCVTLFASVALALVEAWKKRRRQPAR